MVRQAVSIGWVKLLHNQTLWLCDPQVTSTKEAAEAVGVALPLMLKKGVCSPQEQALWPDRVLHCMRMQEVCLQAACRDADMQLPTESEESSVFCHHSFRTILNIFCLSDLAR